MYYFETEFIIRNALSVTKYNTVLQNFLIVRDVVIATISFCLKFLKLYRVSVAIVEYLPANWNYTITVIGIKEI